MTNTNKAHTFKPLALHVQQDLEMPIIYSPKKVKKKKTPVSEDHGLLFKNQSKLSLHTLIGADFQQIMLLDQELLNTYTD